MKILLLFPLQGVGRSIPLLAMIGMLAACKPAPPPMTREPLRPGAPPITAPAQQRPADGSSGAGNISQRQRQADFLNRIRQADPQYKTIDRALLNEQNELGLILDRSFSMDSIPALMRTMLTQLAKEFPGQDLNVIAYAPSNPPMKIGTGHLNASTRDMTYTAEHP